MASLLIALWLPLAPDPHRPWLGQDPVWDLMEKPPPRPLQSPGPEQEKGLVDRTRGMSLPLARFVTYGRPHLSDP